MKAKLVLVGGDMSMDEIELRLPAILGRGQNSTVSLPYPLVSRRHCEIVEENNKLVVRDLGSLNGTFVGCQRVSRSELNHGDLLTVGTLTFRAIYAGMPMHFPPCHLDDAGLAKENSVTDTVRVEDSFAESGLVNTSAGDLSESGL
jgi:hypothetical protein